MGICSNIIKPSKHNEDYHKFCTYPRKCTVNIKNFRKSSSDPFAFILTDPIQLKSEQFSIGSLTLSVSQCILPGIDPRGQYFKKCQDNCLVLSTPTTLFLALFDGHGPDGSKIVNFCSVFSEKFFHSFPESVIPIQSSPHSFLTSLCETCDSSLKSISPKINSDYSGTTAVFSLLHLNILYTASLGDCRGVLCTRRKLPALVPFIPQIEDELISILKQKRKTPLDDSLLEVQLTRDLKPEDPEEYQRIVEAGGRVKRLLDDDGNKVGPFRVWHSEANTPGLTMTRSIGDQASKSIGLLSTPVITEMEIDNREDLFVVVASDGIWHCMDNKEVVNFVEFFRPLSCKEIVKHRDSEVSVSNSCIAQILCEEARARWLTVVEEEDVEIDDISCIVIEIFGAERKGQKSQTVKVEKVIREKIATGKKRGGKLTPTVKVARIKDPKRGSHVAPETGFGVVLE